ncbi:MAG TPA: DUF308 domain-containing protein, partial [Sphingomicrobium sp.]|nr:DUF308 domain-containing protein [Sphingomicrobium sp.]
KKSFGDWPGWDYLPGIAFMALGFLALMEAPLASVATGIYLGAMLCVAGAFGLVGGIGHIGRHGALLAALLGLLSLLVGAAVLYNPIAGAVSMTWLIGAWLIVGGIFELGIGFTVKIGRGWLILVGVVDLVLGGLVFMMNPRDAFLFLGYYVGISFLARGLWSLVFVGEVHQAGHVLSEAIA